MQEINITPMVDILSEITNKIVVMNGEDYVFLDSLKKVTAKDLALGVNLQNEKQLAKAKANETVEKIEALANLIVTTQSGKVFYADTESRVDLNDAIRKAEKENLSNTPWKLAEAFEGERVVIVTLEEIREAADLALLAKASIVGVIQIKEGE